jgi:ACS family tartrate transporter-like MFS transporter
VTGFVVALVYAASVPAMILWGRSCDRRDVRIWHAALAALLAAAGLALASVVPNHMIRLVSLAVAEAGLASALAPFYSVPALFLGGRAMAGGFALISSIASLIGGFAGQYAIGLIREATGGYAAVLVAMAAALTMTALIVLGLARTIAPKPALIAAQTADA